MLRLSVSPVSRLRGCGCAGIFGLAALSVVLAALTEAPAEARTRYPSRERAESSAASMPARLPEGPLQIIISLGSQRLWVYDSKGLLETSTISTGVGGYPTPLGVFAVIDKEQTHYSNIYGGASMPFMQRLTMSGVALHSGMVTGRPASHGCVRLPHPFAIKLYKLTKLGVRVIIAPNEPTPEDIVHTNLFVRKPAPQPEAVDTNSAKGIALVLAADMTTATANAKVGKITAERAEELQRLPISVLVSRADGKVIVRHGFRQIYEAPITIRDPDRPLGTHVYTALEFRDGGNEMRWRAVSVPSPAKPSSTHGRFREHRAARRSRHSRSRAGRCPPLPRLSIASIFRERPVTASPRWCRPEPR